MKRRSTWALAAVCMLAAVGCTKNEKQPQQAETGATQSGSGNSGANVTGVVTSPEQSGEVKDLKIDDLKVGTGAEAVAGKTVTVHYRGTLTDGKQFDASYDRGQPFKFSLGAGQVIPGWDKGVAGMKVGGKRKLIIPSQLAYGASGAGNGLIPPNATLVFEVELLDVK